MSVHPVLRHPSVGLRVALALTVAVSALATLVPASPAKADQSYLPSSGVAPNPGDVSPSGDTRPEGVHHGTNGSVAWGTARDADYGGSLVVVAYALSEPGPGGRFVKVGETTTASDGTFTVTHGQGPGSAVFLIATGVNGAGARSARNGLLTRSPISSTRCFAETCNDQNPSDAFCMSGAIPREQVGIGGDKGVLQLWESPSCSTYFVRATRLSGDLGKMVFYLWNEDAGDKKQVQRHTKVWLDKGQSSGNTKMWYVPRGHRVRGEVATSTRKTGLIFAQTPQVRRP